MGGKPIVELNALIALRLPGNYKRLAGFRFLTSGAQWLPFRGGIELLYWFVGCGVEAYLAPQHVGVLVLQALYGYN